MLRPAHEIVLNALKIGKEVKLGDYTVVMEENQLYRPGTRVDTRTGTTEDILMAFNVPLNWFLRQCEAIPQDDLIVMAAETALTQMSTERTERRESKGRIPSCGTQEAHAKLTKQERDEKE